MNAIDTLATESNPERQIKNLERLQQMYGYKKNWNLYDADPIPHKTLDRMKDLVTKIRIQGRVFPFPGGIQYEYEKPTGEYLEFHLEDDNLEVLSVYQVDKDGNDKEFDVPATAEEIDKLILEFFKGDSRIIGL